MKRLKLVQGSADWRAFRATHDNASEASVMMGKSKNLSRSDLVRMKATGAEQEFSAWVQKNLLDKGHAIEKAALPRAVEIIGEDLYPCTGESTEYPNLGASFDGISLLGKYAWECKSWNEAKAADVRSGKIPDCDFWQVVQQSLVADCVPVLYMVSDGNGKEVHIWYEPNQGDYIALLKGWEQFDIDVANYTAEEKAPEVVGSAVTSLPAVFVRVDGEIIIRDNLSAFAVALTDFIENRLILNPLSDQDFADLDLQIKALKNAESALDTAEAQMLAQVESVDTLKRQKDMLHDMARKNRLMAEKLLAAKKESIKADIRQQGIDDYRNHVAEINARIGVSGVSLPDKGVEAVARITGAMKNKRTIDSLRDAVSTELAAIKIDINTLACKIETNLQSLRDMAQDHRFLFNDRQELVLKDNEVLVMIINQRIGDHIKEEERRLEAERERIRKEEADRVEREHAEKVERERIAEEDRIQSEIDAQKRAEIYERNENFKADVEQWIDDVRNDDHPQTIDASHDVGGNVKEQSFTDDNHRAIDTSSVVDGIYEHIIAGFDYSEEEISFLRRALFDIYQGEPNPVGIAATALRQVGAIQ